MSIMVRLYEKLTGRAHQHQNADMMNEATERLVATTKRFNENLDQYSESDNPLSMLFEDIRNQRGAGSGDGKSKLFS